MAGLGFKDFQVGEVLTSSDVDGYLMQQTVMRFADSGARGSALGTAAGTGVALAEGMVSYLDDVNRIEIYTGSAWVTAGGFSASTAITTTDTSWPVPTLADPVIRVVCVGGGGGGAGGPGASGGAGGNGGSSSFACSAGTATASGGIGGPSSGFAVDGTPGTDGFASGNGGMGERGGTSGNNLPDGMDGAGGAITIAYFDMTGISTANVTVGAGGTGGGGQTGVGGDGVVIVEYRAG